LRKERISVVRANKWRGRRLKEQKIGRAENRGKTIEPDLA